MTEEIDSWIEHMKKNPTKWKKEHTEFINSQFVKSDDFISRLLKTKNGRQKVIDAYGVRNISGYSGLLG